MIFFSIIIQLSLTVLPPAVKAFETVGKSCLFARPNYQLYELTHDEVKDTQGCTSWGRYDDQVYACCWPGDSNAVCAIGNGPEKPGKPVYPEPRRRPDICFYNPPAKKCYWAVPSGGLSSDAYIEQEPGTCGDFYDHKLFYWWKMCCDEVDAGPAYRPRATYLACRSEQSILNPRGPAPLVNPMPIDPYFMSTPKQDVVYVLGVYCFADHTSVPLIGSK